MKETKKTLLGSFAVKKLWLVVAALIVLGITLRLVPHTANVAPVGAIALFAGALLGRRAGMVAPLVVMIIADLFLGLHSAVLFTWGGFALIGLFGSLLAKRSTFARIGLGALGSALIFYVVSNFGVWITSGMYAHNFAGLIECYTLALPFLRASFMGDFAFAATFFGLYALFAQQLAGTVSLRSSGRHKQTVRA